MKTFMLSLTAAAAVLISGPGCASTGGGDFDAGDITPAVKVAALNGTWFALQEHPEWRPGFEMAVTELRFLAAQETIDFATIVAIANRLPVDELQSTEARLVITSATILLAEYGGKIIPLESTDDIRAISIALADGIELGLPPPA